MCSSVPHRAASFLHMQLRLNSQQLDEKRAAEAAVDEIKELLEAATSEASKEQLQEELNARQGKLDELMAGFEVGGWVLNGGLGVAAGRGCRVRLLLQLRGGRRPACSSHVFQGGRA